MRPFLSCWIRLYHQARVRRFKTNLLWSWILIPKPTRLSYIYIYIFGLLMEVWLKVRTSSPTKLHVISVTDKHAWTLKLTYSWALPELDLGEVLIFQTQNIYIYALWWKCLWRSIRHKCDFISENFDWSTKVSNGLQIWVLILIVYKHKVPKYMTNY